MFIAHLPAGYLLGKVILKDHPLPRATVWAWILGSLAPDLDLIWFYTLGHRQHPHHAYWTHLPFVWAVLWVIAAIVRDNFPNARLSKTLCAAFLPFVFLHLLLDSVVGKIAWAFPLTRERFSLFEVASVHDHWLLNFLMHPSFLLEILICLMGVWVYKKVPPKWCGSCRSAPRSAPD